MTDNPFESLKDIWPAQAELNAKAGFDTAGIGKKLAEAMARSSGELLKPTLR